MSFLKTSQGGLPGNIMARIHYGRPITMHNPGEPSEGIRCRLPEGVRPSEEISPNRRKTKEWEISGHHDPLTVVGADKQGKGSCA